MNTPVAIPASAGTYLLLADCRAPKTIPIGRLGPVHFDTGVYAYVGSAHGPGGLAARLGRHIAGSGRKHWHIDYLLAHTKIIGALYKVGATRHECSWAVWARKNLKGEIAGFGASDCACESHLFFFGTEVRLEEILDAAGCELKAEIHLEGDHGL